jgi:hypothetical protein
MLTDGKVVSPNGLASVPNTVQLPTVRSRARGSRRQFQPLGPASPLSQPGRWRVEDHRVPASRDVPVYVRALREEPFAYSGTLFGKEVVY